MSTYSTEAVILRARDFGEADRLITLYTLGQGKVTAKVRGARKSASRLGGVTMPLTHVEVMLWRGRSSIESLTQAVSRDAFSPLRTDLARLAYANLAVELVDMMTEERVASPETFVALLSAMTMIAYGERPDVPAYALAMRMLSSSGVLAALDTCVACGRSIDPSSEQSASYSVADSHVQPASLLGWSSSSAGPLCAACMGAPAPGDQMPPRLLLMLRPDTLGVLRQLLQASPRTLAALRPGPDASRQIRAVLWDCLQANLDRPPRSLAFLDTLLPLT